MKMGEIDEKRENDVESEIEVESEYEDGSKIEEEEIEDSNVEDLIKRELTTQEIQYFDGLCDEELITFVENVEKEKIYLSLENRVFKNFLQVNEPTLLSGLPQAIDAIKQLDIEQPLLPTVFENRTGNVGTTAKTYMFSSEGNRINLSQRTDLVLRDVEEMQGSLNVFVEQARRLKFKYNAEIEESFIRGEEIREARDTFEQSIVIDAVDPITQRIPAEKFIWYMQDWLKNARLVTEKIRLRNNSLKIQYNKLKNLLIQKIELGESIHEVDFEQLRIENKHLLQKIDQKNTHLIQLKRINGKANLNLATHKNYLQKILEGLKTIQLVIDTSVDQTKEHLREKDIAKKELDDAIVKYNEVKNLIDHYKVPEVFEYVKVKSRYYELRKALKIMARRMNITKIILNTHTMKMMKLTKSKCARPEWYRMPDDDDYDDMYDEDEYYQSIKKMKCSSEFDIFNALK